MQSTTLSRRRNTPANLGIKIAPPPANLPTVVAEGDTPFPSGPPSEPESVSLPSPTKPRSARNVKRLSLTLQTKPSSSSLTIATQDQPPIPPSPAPEPRRRPSVVSLPATTILRQREEESPSVPYADGPIEILPGIWLGSEDSARDWRGLIKRGIKSILNVAKEVTCPIDASTSRPLRSSVSTSDLSVEPQDSSPIYFPAHIPSGRPGLNYLKLPWSHGQPDLVNVGLPAAFDFVDKSIARGDGVLIQSVFFFSSPSLPTTHVKYRSFSCQCGISRSGTLIIALVMRAAARCSTAVPSEVWALKGMQGAYSYVKEKSKWVGPNMSYVIFPLDPVVRLMIILPSLIYQLLDYERALKSGGANSPTFSDRSSIVAAEEEEWGRRRSMLDNDPSDADVEEDRDVTEVAREARALDKAMEDRMLARKSSSSSIASSGLGMGLAWKSRYSGRRRAGSIASNLTNGSILSEDLVEEEEEEELLNVGGGFDNDSRESDATSPDSQYEEESVNRLSFIPQTARPTVQRNPPSGPTSTHKFPRMPISAIQATFDIPPLPRPRLSLKGRRRPPPLSILPPVPSSPINPAVMKTCPPQRTQSFTEPRISAPALLPPRQTPPKPAAPSQPLPTPSQTLFVFPPSPDALPSAAPSTMILTPSVNTLAFPGMKTPRLSMRGSRGRPQSFIAQATPTTAFSLVDVRGWVGMK